MQFAFCCKAYLTVNVVQKMIFCMHHVSKYSGGFRVGEPEGRLKRGHLMTSSYSANRDENF